MGKKKDKSAAGKAEIVEIALDLAVKQGWERVTLRDIADAAGLGLADLQVLFEDKSDILTALGRMIDQKVLEGIGEFDSESSARDRLFDILMDRFEALNDHREGICAILSSFKYDPKQAVICMPHLCRSMTWMLEAAGIETFGIKGAIKVAGLTGLYIKLLKVWEDDTSADLPKTMAALDKALARVEKTATTLGL